jgi:hypothetical protein
MINSLEHSRFNKLWSELMVEFTRRILKQSDISDTNKFKFKIQKLI